MKRRTFLQGSGALVLAGAAPSIAFGQENTITFGGSVPMSGAAAETGLNVLQGYQCAVKYINEEKGGIEVGGNTYKLALNLFDDASDPSRATTLIQRQVDSFLETLPLEELSPSKDALLRR